jgi:hypothetical protein
MGNLETDPVQIGIVLVIAGVVLFGLMRLILYLDRRHIRTHPSQKKVRRYVLRGQLKKDKKRAKRKLRF